MLSWATAYYAHSLAACIVKENPRIKQVFDSWKAQSGSKGDFYEQSAKESGTEEYTVGSNCLADKATNEAKQKQRIATLFDLNTMDSSWLFCRD